MRFESVRVRDSPPNADPAQVARLMKWDAMMELPSVESFDISLLRVQEAIIQKSVNAVGLFVLFSFHSQMEMEQVVESEVARESDS